MSSRLIINPGTPQAWEIQLKPGLNRIGRGEDNDFVISHQSVSTHHCEVTVSNDGVLLKDLGSTNGTFVSRAAVRESKLQSGQHVQLGSVDMTFESTTSAAHTPAPIPVAAPMAAPPPPPPPGLRINREHSAPPTPAAGPVAGITPPPPPAPGQFKPLGSANTEKPEGNFALSLGGVLLGAVIGMVVWHLIYRFSGWGAGIMALGIGCLAGVAPQVIGHYRSKWMGVIAAVITLAAIFTTQYFNAKLQYNNFVDDTSNELYDARLKYAKEAIATVPNGTDDEIRKFLATEQSFEEHKVKPEDIEAEELADFKKELPELRDMAAGKISKEQYNKELNEGREQLEDSVLMKIYFIFRALGIFNIVNIVFGVGAAYMTAKGDR